MDDEEALCKSMQESLSTQNLKLPPKICIFKTPTILLRHNRRAYMPTAFSIGPFHHHKAHLKRTENIKWKYLADLLNRSSPASASASASASSSSSPSLSSMEEGESPSVNRLVKAMWQIEKEAREHYGDQIAHVTPCELVKIMVLDGCFLIEFFRRNKKIVMAREKSMTSSMSATQAESKRQPIDKGDPVFNMACIYQNLCHDLILLENQIPWMVVKRLFDLTISNFEPSTIIEQLVSSFFRDMFQSSNYMSKEELDEATKKASAKNPGHLLQLLREVMISSTSGDIQQPTPCCWPPIPSTPELEATRSCWPPIPSASELYDAGVTFKRMESTFIFGISFSRGVLALSPILIQETTETLFRNLIGLEQCLLGCPPIFTSYAILLDNLINTTHDIAVLSNANIVDNWLNPDDAVKFFNKLYHDAYVKDFYYQSLCNAVKRYPERRWPRWRALLMRNYLNTPWAATGTFAAFLIVVLTFLQTLLQLKDSINNGNGNNKNSMRSGRKFLGDPHFP